MKYTWTTNDHGDRCPFARACSSNTYINVRFGTYSRPIRDRDRDTKFEKSKSKTRNKWHAPFVPVSLSIFQIKFPETGWTREKGTRDQRLCQPARPYLLIIKHIHTRSMLPILTSRPIFKKWQNRHTNTLAPRFSHAYHSGADLN